MIQKYIFKKPHHFVDKYISRLKNTGHFYLMLSFENRGAPEFH